MHVLALYNVKGGVGKTAAAVNLAHLAAQDGLRTLLWDLDAQGGASWYLQSGRGEHSFQQLLRDTSAARRLAQPTRYERLDLIPASFSYRYLDVMLKKVQPPRRALQRLLRPFARQYDLVVLDCPPSLSHLADNVLTASTLVLVPVIPTPLSLRAMQQLRAYVQEHDLQDTYLKPFFSMVDRRRAQHALMLEYPPSVLNGLCRTWVPYASMIERMGEQRAPLCTFTPPSHPAAVAYRELHEEVQRALARAA